MEKTFKIGDYSFVKSSYYTCDSNGKVYRNVCAGLIENPMKATRRVNGYAIHADRFVCALSYTNYYIVDPKNKSVYVSKDNHFGNVKELAEEFGKIENIENFFEDFNK